MFSSLYADILIFFRYYYIPEMRFGTVSKSENKKSAAKNTSMLISGRDFLMILFSVFNLESEEPDP